MNVTLENYKPFFAQLDNNLSELEAIGNDNVRNAFLKIKEKFKEVQEGGDQLMADNDVLRIGVVGQVKAGKSSFLNSLFFDGENVLPRASTPMTAGLTVLKYGEENQFEVEYYNTVEWETFESKAKDYDRCIKENRSAFPNMTDEEIAKQLGIENDLVSAKELVSKCGRNALSNIQKVSKKVSKPFSDIRDLQDVLEEYVGANGKYTSIVKCLTIQMNDKHLEGIQIVDTPGVNDPVLSREQRTREFLRSCHGVFFLSYSGRFFDKTDQEFLENRIGDQGIGTVVLIASKFDSVLQDVGKQFNDDLGNAIDECSRKLKKQYRTNIEQTEFKGKDPIFDINSGIGFSIAKKPREQWDSIEAHVVERMQSYYPSFFKTDEEIKDAFLNLAQIEAFRSKYLEDVFKRNKDKIIQEKVEGYFRNVTVQLKKIVERENGKLKSAVNDLETTSLAEMKEKEAAYGQVIDTMERHISSIVCRVDDRATKAQKDCWNKFHFGLNVSVPKKSKTASFKRMSTFWGREKNFSYTYSIPDLNKLMDDMRKELSSELTQLNDSWEKESQKLHKFILDKLVEIISDCEKNDTMGKIDGERLRLVLNETLDSLSNEATLNVRELLEQFQFDLASNLQGYDYINCTPREESEEDAKRRIQQAANEAMGKVEEMVINLVRAVSKDCEVQLTNSREAITDALTGSKRQFIDKIKDDTEKYLDALSKDIQDKENQLEMYNKAVNSLTKIENLL